MKPLLFLDVDGTLIPFGGVVREFGTDPNPLLARLDPAHGPKLSVLPCELVWATTWLDDANDAVAPLLGLPGLAVVHWPEPSEADELDERAGLHWKTRPLVAWAAGQAFVWVDDEMTDRDRAWVAEHHPGPALLHRVDHRIGVTDADYGVIGAWLSGLERRDSSGRKRATRPVRDPRVRTGTGVASGGLRDEV